MGMVDAHQTHGKCTDCSLLALRQEVIKHKAEAHSLRSLRLLDAKRIELLEEKLAKAQAQLRYERDQRYGKKNEQKGSKGGEGKAPQNEKATKKKRGRQPGSTAPKRRPLEGLTTQEEEAKVDDNLRNCPCCGLPLSSMPPETVTVREIEVKSYFRKINKERLTPTCHCGALPGVVTASAVGPLFPGSNLGVSMFGELLMGRFHDGLSMNRVLERLASYGHDLAPGTIHSLLPNILELMKPIFEEIAKHNREAKHWHADETTHRVFVEVPGKVGHRWYLWVFVSKDSTVFMMRKDRSAQAIRDHLGMDAEGIISADRAKMYIAYAGENPKIEIAFCWVHARRDFLKIAVEYPELKSWADAWSDRISYLFHLDHNRSNSPQDEALLRKAMAEFETDWRLELASAKPHTPQIKVLTSLNNHWIGLTVFLDHPEIPMDNNPAELALRWEVIARKSIYGCRSLASAELLATMASITTTLEQNGRSIRDWLISYLTACARNGGKPPQDVSPWLPWPTVVQEGKVIAA